MNDPARPLCRNRLQLATLDTTVGRSRIGGGDAEIRGAVESRCRAPLCHSERLGQASMATWRVVEVTLGVMIVLVFRSAK